MWPAQPRFISYLVSSWIKTLLDNSGIGGDRLAKILVIMVKIGMRGVVFGVRPHAEELDYLEMRCLRGKVKFLHPQNSPSSKLTIFEVPVILWHIWCCVFVLQLVGVVQ